MLPWSVWESVFGPLAMDFSTWIVAGLMIVVGAVWVIVYNADLLLGAVDGACSAGSGARARSCGCRWRTRSARRFRTGTTLAMFTLVVFTLVTGAASNGSFRAAFDNEDDFGGGFQVRAGTGGAAPIDDMRGGARRAPGARPADFPVVGSQSVLAVDATQLGTGRPLETYLVRGLDASFLEHTTFGLGAIATGYELAREVWDGARDDTRASPSSTASSCRAATTSTSALPSDFPLTGFYYDDGEPFDPIPVEVVDTQTGRPHDAHGDRRSSSDSAPFEMVGISTSQKTLAAAFPGRARPTIHYFAARARASTRTRRPRELESAFLANGLEAQSIREVVDDAVAANRTFNRLIQGFMGLGLVVGVAALGVISARAVVERRQQIGVHARDRLPPRDGPGGRSCSSRRSSRSPRSSSARRSGCSSRGTSSTTSAQTAELGEPRRWSCRGATSP